MAEEVSEVALAVGTTEVTTLAGLQLPNDDPKLALVNRGRTSSATAPACGFDSVNVGLAPTALSTGVAAVCTPVRETLSTYQPLGSSQQLSQPPLPSKASRNRIWITRPANCDSDAVFGAKALDVNWPIGCSSNAGVQVVPPSEETSTVAASLFTQK